MKKILMLIFALCIIAGVIGCGGNKDKTEQSQTQTEDKPSFTAVNLTDMEVYELYISVSGTEKWGESLLGKNKVFRRGDEMKIEYPGLNDKDMYDIRCVDSGGRELCFKELNLSVLTKISLAVDENGNAVVSTEENGV